MDGLFIENGPFKLNEAGKLVENPYSWHKYASILYGRFSTLRFGD
jgi:carboxypeptidase C (cathepsin A)